ncbi:hypothetical protein ES332_D03G063300v1 [Gossypium tomentosum]|uniref:Uncharacterized protein n=1 Tax=Gossypium tomentosum TaxID=34277 RepID=A0A5D2LJN6_GOSTO|nr:hypothetical protein ES332_D03G063300v1 [Gossypium tomentosum]
MSRVKLTDRVHLRTVNAIRRIMFSMSKLLQKGTLWNRSNGGEVGPVAQRIRTRGYKPWCRGFVSLLTHNRPKRERSFPLG